MRLLPILLATGLSARLLAAEEAPSRFVAHEWGTFTSVQGADGVQLEWNPFSAVELPAFVYDATRPASIPDGAVQPQRFLAGKVGFNARQRMETPVIYFYADRPQPVDVEVVFRNGRVTEWYPQLARWESPRPEIRFGSDCHVLRWKGEIVPGAESTAFPRAAGGSHYYAARETDAAPVRVRTAAGGFETEKFLFYRGVGEFQAPLKVAHRGRAAERLRLENTGPAGLDAAFVFSRRGGRAAVLPLEPLAPGTVVEREFDFERLAGPLSEVRARLAASLRAALASAGLYPREAAAMVQTWDDSWFDEPGTRVLYLLPAGWAEHILPLRITPAPAEIRRVFVGRAEIITEAQEDVLRRAAQAYTPGNAATLAAARGLAAESALGRFTEAGLQRLRRAPGEPDELRPRISALLEALRREARTRR